MSQNDPILLEDGTPMSPEQIRAEFQRMQEEIEQWRFAAEVEARERRRSSELILKMQALLKDVAAKRIVEIETLFEEHGLDLSNQMYQMEVSYD